MPAPVSSPIPSGLAPRCDADPLQEAEPPALLDCLATIPNSCRSAGRRHPLVAILGLAAAAVLAGARSITAIAEWAADTPQPVRAALGARRDPPPQQRDRRRAVAVDGKTVRVERCQRLPWHRVPVGDRTRDRGHGRVEIRTLKVVSVKGFGFPHAAQILQVTRKRRDLHTTRWQIVTVYAITSLPLELARPARLADLLRGHWAIEALHHVRDVTFAEDDSQVRTGAAPGVMAALRNLAIGALSRAGPVSIATALRHHARDPARPLATLGITQQAATDEPGHIERTPGPSLAITLDREDVPVGILEPGDFAAAGAG